MIVSAHKTMVLFIVGCFFGLVLVKPDRVRRSSKNSSKAMRIVCSDKFCSEKYERNQ